MFANILSEPLRGFVWNSSVAPYFAVESCARELTRACGPIGDAGFYGPVDRWASSGNHRNTSRPTPDAVATTQSRHVVRRAKEAKILQLSGSVTSQMWTFTATACQTWEISLDSLSVCVERA